LKAPRLIARSPGRPRQVGGARTVRKDRSGQAKCDLANTETHSDIPNGRSCHSSRVKVQPPAAAFGPAAGV
jgi:hypothetical protein